MTTKFTNTYIWCGIAFSLAGCGQQLSTVFLSDSSGPEGMGNIAQFCYVTSWIVFLIDYFKLKQHGIHRPHWIWIATYGLFPIYLWKRSSLLDGDRKPFWTYVGGIFILVFFVALNAITLGEQKHDSGPPTLARVSQHEKLTTEDRQRLANWLRSMGPEFQAINLSSASIPLYRNQSTGGLLGFIAIGNGTYVFFSSVNEESRATCDLFSEFSYTNDTIIMVKYPEVQGSYDEEKDSFLFKQGVDNCCLRDERVSLHGRYKRIASCFCEMHEDGRLVVTQILAE